MLCRKLIQRVLQGEERLLLHHDGERNILSRDPIECSQLMVMINSHGLDLRFMAPLMHILDI